MFSFFLFKLSRNFLFAAQRVERIVNNFKIIFGSVFVAGFAFHRGFRAIENAFFEMFGKIIVVINARLLFDLDEHHPKSAFVG